MTCSDLSLRQDKRLKDCCPPEFENVWMYGFYSPGVCPSGYTIGCAYTVNMPWSAWDITSSESAAWCVPTSYACWHPSGMPDKTGEDTRATASSNSRDTVPAFQIRWQKSDSSLFVVTTSSTEQPSTSSPTPMPGPTSSQGPSATRLITTTTETTGGSPGGGSTAEPRGRNTGVLVGEILGPILGVLLIVVLWFWIWRRRSLSRLSGATDAPPEARDPEGDDPGDEAEDKKQSTAYLDGNPISELEGKRQEFAYLDGNPISELSTAGSLPGHQATQYGASPQSLRPAAVISSCLLIRRRSR
ncbi:hypothetical protein GE09DRAFT_558347 [Coniochaeta sp. 2T2.1]|nr:hypothetical protein GE09DRAFT_558347 [Coniochaeta sp. 2T2.1]